MLSGRSITYPVSQATSGSEAKSHMSVRFEGVCAHEPLRAARDRDAFDGVEGVDLVGVRSGSVNSLGWPRVDTILVEEVRCYAVCDE